MSHMGNPSILMGMHGTLLQSEWKYILKSILCLCIHSLVSIFIVQPWKP